MLSRQHVGIVAVIRRMRGGSQPFLIRASDGACYIAKFTNNPQGNRTLINECIAGHLLSVLGVTTPDLAILHLSDSCQGREQLYFSTDRQESIVNGFHLGSKCPVDPDLVAIHDSLSRTLYAQVENLQEVGVVFAFDQWSTHGDNRQFIFARKPNSVAQSQWQTQMQSRFTAWAIDNGMCFGKDWILKKRRCHAFHYVDIYSHFDVEVSVSRGAQLIQSLPVSELQAACQNIPPDWFAPMDKTALEAMLKALHERQQGLMDSVHAHLSVMMGHKRQATLE